MSDKRSRAVVTNVTEAIRGPRDVNKLISDIPQTLGLLKPTVWNFIEEKEHTAH